MSTQKTYSITEILAEQGENETENFLRQQFHCSRNLDVENFLHNKAIRFEKADAARTYLIFDNNFRILAYFSLTFKTVEFNNISKTLNKKLTGGFSDNNSVKVFLIGQIGKNDIQNNPIKLSDILDIIFQKIQQATRLISGRVVVLECENNLKLISLYERHGFSVIETLDNQTLKTMFIIPEFKAAESN